MWRTPGASEESWELCENDKPPSLQIWVSHYNVNPKWSEYESQCCNTFFFVICLTLAPTPAMDTYEELIYYPYIKSKWNYISYLQWNTVLVPQNVWIHLSLIKKQKIWSGIDWFSQCSVLTRIWSIISAISRQQNQFIIWKASLKSKDSWTWQSIALISRFITC